MDVTRVQHDHGSRIEPPLNPSWPDSVKLEWEAAVVAHDTGLSVSVTPARSQTWSKLLRRWVDDHGLYDITVGSATSGPHSYQQARDCLHGVSLGARQARRAAQEV